MRAAQRTSSVSLVCTVKLGAAVLVLLEDGMFRAAFRRVICICVIVADKVRNNCVPAVSTRDLAIIPLHRCDGSSTAKTGALEGNPAGTQCSAAMAS